MARPRKQHQSTASEQLVALLGHPWPFSGRPSKHGQSTWIITDDWPRHAPATETEVGITTRKWGLIAVGEGILHEQRTEADLLAPQSLLAERIDLRGAALPYAMAIG